MSEKSHVSVEQHVCVVCGQPYDTGNILINRRLNKKFDVHTITGWGMCDEHAKMREANYVALVAIDEKKSGVFTGTKTIDPTDVYRLGSIAHVKSELFIKMFDIELPKNMVAFVQPEVIDNLQHHTEEVS